MCMCVFEYVCVFTVVILCVCVLSRHGSHCVCVPLSPGQFPYAETSWSECRRLSLEFRELSSAILGGGPGLNVTSTVIATGWAERVNGTWLVAAVNPQNKPV